MRKFQKNTLDCLKEKVGSLLSDELTLLVSVINSTLTLCNNKRVRYRSLHLHGIPASSASNLLTPSSSWTAATGIILVVKQVICNAVIGNAC